MRHGRLYNMSISGATSHSPGGKGSGACLDIAAAAALEKHREPPEAAPEKIPSLLVTVCRFLALNVRCDRVSTDRRLKLLAMTMVCRGADRGNEDLALRVCREPAGTLG